MADNRARVALDTSVWVNYLTDGATDDPEWLAHSRRVVRHAELGEYRIVVPTLVIAEIAGTGEVRGSHLRPEVRQARVDRVREWMTSSGSFLVVELHERIAASAASTAIEYQLKGGDAVIATSALAAKASVLLSWDDDHLKLDGEWSSLRVMTPRDFELSAEDLMDLIDS